MLFGYEIRRAFSGCDQLLDNILDQCVVLVVNFTQYPFVYDVRHFRNYQVLALSLKDFGNLHNSSYSSEAKVFFYNLGLLHQLIAKDLHVSQLLRNLE